MFRRGKAGQGPPDGSAPPKPARQRRERSVVGRLVAGTFGLLGTVAVVGGMGAGIYGWHMYGVYSAELPSLDTLSHYQPRVMSRVYAGDDRLIAELATERRIFVPIAAVPDLVKQAFLSAEDQKFWSHKGIDPAAIARAAWTDLQQYGQGRRPVGASTITQQVAKNMLLGSNEVSIARKAKELILALRIDQSMPKEKVLEVYLNEIYLGLQAHGVAAAAQAYFNKGLNELTLPEAAFLAILPKAPNNYNPARYPDAAKSRRDWVLDRMTEDHAITVDQAARAKATPIQVSPFHRPETVPGAEWIAEEVRRQMLEKYGPDATTQGGYVIRTSLDPAMQAAGDVALRRGLMAYDRSHGGWRGPVGHMADAGGSLGWLVPMKSLPRPPGMLAEWRHAVVLDMTATEARVGWVSRGAIQMAPDSGVIQSIFLSDLGWARPVGPNGLGAPPRKMADVVGPGDLVMVEAVPASPGKPSRALLRQVPQVQGALVSLDPLTGRVLAMSGGWSGDASQFNRATQAQRQPGSSFKPIVYLTALQAGFSPSQRILDAPYVQNMGAQGVWKPSNYGGSFNGPTPMRIALEKSLNLVSVRLAEKVGMDAVAQNAIAFHVVDSMPKVLPAALGAVETTVLRQASAYAALAMGGREVLPSLVDSVQDRDGKIVWRASGIECQGCKDPAKPPVLIDSRRQIADPQSVFQIVTMMQGVVARGTGYEAGRGLNRAIAGKTGTTQDSHDAWFVGFTPDLVTAVWIGYDDSTSLGDKETGGGVAAPIWREFMEKALKTRPSLQFRMPDGVRMAAWESGAGSRTDAFKPGQDPGASQATIGGGVAAPDGGDMALGVSTTSGGVGIDSGVGGLY